MGMVMITLSFGSSGQIDRISYCYYPMLFTQPSAFQYGRIYSPNLVLISMVA